MMSNTPVTLSKDLERRLKDAKWKQITIGCSDSQTYQLINNGNISYLKWLKADSNQSLFPEKERLEWLKGKLPVPEILTYEHDNQGEALWITEVPGIHAADRSWTNQLPKIIPLIAEGLKMIHSLNIDDCPFDHQLDQQIRKAKDQVHKDLADEGDFDEKRKGRTA